MSINKAVLYLALAAVLTIWTMLYVAKRMKQRPNKVQTAVESAYQLMKTNIAGGNMDAPMAKKWFPFIGALFLFIWWSNMIGYVPLPTNTHEKFDLFGAQIPSFALYAATANISVPLALTLVVWISYHVEGVRAKGPIGYLKSWVPAGVEGPAAVPIFFIEVISHFVRIISLSVRLFANILAGHLLILFMAGGLVVLLGLPALGSSPSRSPSPSSCSKWAWWRRCRRSSSPPSPRSISAAPSPTSTKHKGATSTVDLDSIGILAQALQTKRPPRVCARSRSAWAPVLAPSARASAWATSSARSSSR